MSVNPVSEVANLLGGSGAVGLGEEIASIAEMLRQIQTEEKAAIPRATTARTSSGGSIAGTVLGGVETFFGLGLNPLISGLTSLFGGGGGSGDTAAPLVPFVMPPSVNVNAGFSASAPGVFATDTADGGVARPAPAAQITVQVQALDSQSFLDHSNDIAMAVRQAMLESTTLNDVIREV